MIKTIIITFTVLFAGICMAQQPPIIKAANNAIIESSQLEQLLKTLMQKYTVPGLSFAVINDGQLVYQSVYGTINTQTQQTVTPETVFETASISKSVFSYFVLTQVDKGVLDLDTPLANYLPHPDLQHDARHQLITARMVLAHTSGLPNWRFHNEDGKLDIKFTPGTRFSYSGEGYEYLADVLAVLNKTDLNGLNKLFKKQVCEPLGMTRCTFLTNDIIEYKAYPHEQNELNEDRSIGFPSYFGAAYGFHSESADFSRFLIALMNGRGLQSGTYSEMLKTQFILPADEELRTENGFDSWGLGVIRDATPYGTKYAHGGMNPGFQGYFMIIPEQKFGFVYFGNSDTAIDMLPDLESYLINGQMPAVAASTSKATH